MESQPLCVECDRHCSLRAEKRRELARAHARRGCRELNDEAIMSSISSNKMQIIGYHESRWLSIMHHCASLHRPRPRAIDHGALSLCLFHLIVNHPVRLCTFRTKTSILSDHFSENTSPVNLFALSLHLKRIASLSSLLMSTSTFANA